MNFFSFDQRGEFESKYGNLSEKMDLYAGSWWIAVTKDGKFFARDEKPTEWGNKDKARTAAVLKPAGK